MIDYIIGLKNKIWFKKLPDGRDFLITSEPAVRIFDGTKFSDNLAQDRYMKVIEAMQDEGVITYDQFNGLTIFGRDDAYIPEISPS
jgi:hypothetical protein